MLFKVSLLMAFLALSTVNAYFNIFKDGESNEGRNFLMDGPARIFTDEKYMGISPQEIKTRTRKSISSKTKSNRKFFVFCILIRFYLYIFCKYFLVCVWKICSFSNARSKLRKVLTENEAKEIKGYNQLGRILSRMG